MAEFHVVDPDVTRIVEGLRDTGYTFEAAIADIIDNSIAANAEFINVFAGFDRLNNILVRISDDGDGMDYDQLTNAMRYGSKEREDPHSLGRFGMGLKTASTSFCKRLTVISRPKIDNSALHAATWDLDHIAAERRWILEIGAASASQSDEFNDCISDLELLGADAPHGTVVLWDKVDRLLQKKHGGQYQYPDRELKKRLTSLREHLAMVFQRYLDPNDRRARTVTIAINGERVDPWDPFGEKFGMTPAQPPLELTLTDAAGNPQGEVKLRAFLLLHKDEVEDQAYAPALGFSNTRQGFYTYRENRLIELPGWFGFVVNEPHWNRLRIDLSFAAPSDPFFGVGIKKSGLHLDPGLADLLKEYSDPLRREAQRLHRSGAAARRVTGSNNATRPTELAIARTTDLTRPVVRRGDDGSIAITNGWREELNVVLPGGALNPIFGALVNESQPATAIERADSLEDGVLWRPTVNRNGQGTGVILNVSHDWYRKAYLPYASDNTLVQAIEFLFFALSDAEFLNTAPDLADRFEEFRVNVSRNLRRLVRDLPDYIDEDD